MMQFYFPSLSFGDPKVIAERLGHSTIVLTLDTYSHVMPSMQKDAADELKQILFTKNTAIG